MLPAINRLRLKKDFETVKNKGQGFQGRFFGLLVYPTYKNESRIGFILSRKMANLATQRNRAKRRLREAVRMILPRTKSGFDLLFLGKKSLLKQNFTEVRVEVEKIFKKADLLKK